MVRMISNTEKITKELCEGKALFFFPRFIGEVKYINHQILEMGFKSEIEMAFEEIGPRTDDNPEFVKLAVKCFEGMILRGGILSCCSDPEIMKNAIYCTSDQFHENYEEERQFMEEQYHKMSVALNNILTEPKEAVDAAPDPKVKKANKPPVTKKQIRIIL